MSDSTLDTSYLKLAVPFLSLFQGQEQSFLSFHLRPTPFKLSSLYFSLWWHLSDSSLGTYCLMLSVISGPYRHGTFHCYIPQKNMHVHTPHKHSEWFVMFLNSFAHDKNSRESLRPRALWESGDSVHESDTFHCASVARKANRQLCSRFSWSDGRLKSGSHPSGVQNHWRCFWPRGPFPWSASWELWLLACFVRRALFVNGMGTEVGKTVSFSAWRKPQWMESTTAGRAH